MSLEYERVGEGAPAHYRRIVTEGRHEAPAVLVVSWDRATGGWAVHGEADDRASSSDASLARRMLDALPLGPPGITQDDLAQALGVDRRKFHKPLADAVDSGLVDFYGEGKPGRPRHYFRPESAPSAPGPPPPGGAESARPPYRGADYADDAAESAPGRTPGQTNGTGDPEAVERVFGEERQP